ncbi:MAG: ligase-associated DNA damage response endonuclease PdeM [Hyphomicrobiales bacterium]
MTSARPETDGNAETISFAKMELVPHVSGALWAPEQHALLVADLHFEKASAFAARGVHLPPYDTRSTLRSLKAVCDEFSPRRIICLGDSFHDDRARERMDEESIAQIKAFTSAHDFVWITGNHDEAPPVDLGGTVEREVRLDAITLRHIPTGGLPLFPEIAGHYHPVAVVSRRGRRLRRRCFVSDGSRLIMPSFGALTGGLNVCSPAIKAVFADGNFDAWLVGRDRVYRFPSQKLIG